MFSRRSDRSSAPTAKAHGGQGNHAQLADRLATTSAALQSMLDAIQETAGVIDRKGAVLMINETGARRYNTRPIDMVGANPFQSDGPLWKARGKRLREVIRHGRPVHFEDERDGRTYQNSMYPIRDSSGRIDRMAVVGIDITEQRRAREQVRAADERLRQVLQQSADGLLFVDAKGAIVEFNETCETLFGIARKTVLGRNIHGRETGAKTSQPIVALCNLLRRATQGPHPSFHEDTLHRANGKVVHVQAMWSKIRHGSAEAYAAFIRDVTQLREAQHGLAAANQALEQKNAALREILAHIEEEKSRVEERVQTQVEALLLPLAERLKLRASPHDLPGFALLESHLRGLTRTTAPRVHPSLTTLTARELELVEMIKRDLSNKEIAQLLRISPRTVELHRTRIRRKLGLTGGAVRLMAHLRSL